MQFLISLIASATAAAVPAPKSPETLQPIGKWSVDYGETACLAARSFGDAKKPALLAFRPSLNDATVRIILATHAGATDARHFPLQVSGVKTTGLRFYSRESKRRIVWVDLASAEFDRIAAGKSIELDGEHLNLDLSLAGAGAAVKAMRTCNADLRRHWNADEAGAARVAVRAEPTVRPERLIASGDYPSQALSERRGGRTKVSLLIDEKGATRECVVEEHSGVASIDAQTCIIIMKRSKFTPAQDQSGKPVKSFLSYAFRWQIG